MAAFAGTFLILWIFLGAAVFWAWKERQEKRRQWEALTEKEKESKTKGKTVNQTWWDM